MQASHLSANVWYALPMELESMGLCIEPGGVSLLIGSTNETLKAPAMLRRLKPENN